MNKQFFHFFFSSSHRAGVYVSGVCPRPGPVLHQHDPFQGLRPAQRRLRLLRDILRADGSHRSRLRHQKDESEEGFEPGMEVVSNL